MSIDIVEIIATLFGMRSQAGIVDDESREKPAAETWLEVVRRQVESVRFGLVQIVIHDSEVVEIDRTDKVRLTSVAPKAQGT